MLVILCLEPGMFHSFSCGQPLIGVDHQQLLNKVLAGVRGFTPNGWLFGEVPLLDVVNLLGFLELLRA